MEQLDQLRTMRDQAAERLEAARKALETSPDAKLVSSLSSLIEDLESSLGLSGTDNQPMEMEVEVEVETVELVAEPEAEPEPVLEEPTEIMEKIEKAAKSAAKPVEEMSLEESLEAELLAGDDLSDASKTS